jgi:SAM-dependent methyltransferase
VRPRACGADRGPSEEERKYESRNPVVRRLVERLVVRIGGLLGDRREGLWLDVGTGEGRAAARLGGPLVGVDRDQGSLERAAARLGRARLVRADARALPFRAAAFPTVTCLEVLEHLDDPDAALRELARVTAGRCVVSVPWEPFFRLGNLGRGRHLRRLGNLPGHRQAFGPRRLAALAAGSFREVRVTRCFPWLVAELRAPRRGP